MGNDDGRRHWAEMTSDEILADMQETARRIVEECGDRVPYPDGPFFPREQVERIAAEVLGGPVQFVYLGSWTGRYWQRRRTSQERARKASARERKRRNLAAKHAREER